MGFLRHLLSSGDGALRSAQRLLSFLVLGFWMLLPAAALAGELSDAVSDRFSGAANCAFCHDQWGDALLDQNGRDVSITDDWRATMMAHSFKDPLWQAVMEAEVAENPEHKALVEDKCLTCHAPMARTEARELGAEKLSLSRARQMPLASEGVGCTLCHQIQPKNLGRADTFTGRFELGRERLIYGPYDNVLTMPMRRHVDFTPTFGAHMQSSALCATCHTLFTPVLGRSESASSEFPEQVPFLEWRNSAYAAEGTDCQDCHLPRLDEPIKISARPPWLGPRSPFWRHEFVGGNVFMLRMFLGNSRALLPNADPDQLKKVLAAVRAQLERATELTVAGHHRARQVRLEVRVRNLSGHKFPTGHPYRRAWLHIKLTDQRGRLLFESGKSDKQGRIVGLTSDYAPHYNEITRTDQVQVYQSVMGDLQGRTTWSLLRGARYLKDNRIPPRGFSAEGADSGLVAVIGEAATDSNFHSHRNGSDLVTYLIDVPEKAGPVTAEVELLYQSVTPESIARILSSESPSARAFSRLYHRADKRPERIQFTRLLIPPGK